MVEGVETSEVAEAVALIDDQLVALRAREIVSATDVSDLLLDLRLLLHPSAQPDPEPATA